MSDEPLKVFDAAVAQADRVIAAVPADALALPSPCDQWDVRAVVNHMVTGNLMFVSLVTGGPKPDRTADHLGADPVAAFRDAAARLSDAFVRHDVLSGTFPTPFGTGPGTLLVHMRIGEMVAHAWDVAAPTGQADTLDPVLAEQALSIYRSAPRMPRGEGSPFGAEVEAPPDADPVTRLAAFLGRAV